MKKRDRGIEFWGSHKTTESLIWRPDLERRFEVDGLSKCTYRRLRSLLRTDFGVVYYIF